MPIVKLPNGQRLNFPEGMSQDEMHQAIIANFPQFAPENYKEPDNESKGVSGVLSDLISKGFSTAVGLPSAIAALPGEAYGGAKQILTNPKRAAQNIGGGFGDVGHGLLSSLGNVRDYLAKKDLISKNAPSLRLPESILPKDFNYQEALGRQGQQKGDALLAGLPAGAALLPVSEFALGQAAKLPGISSKGIARQLSQNKQKAIREASADYNQFFDTAKQLGVKEVEVPKMDSSKIINHSIPKYHESLKQFLKNPTLENAHWAQSELGALERHLTKLHDKQGLTPTEIRTLRATTQAKDNIKKSMFSNKGLGGHEPLAERYNQLSSDYLEKVIPYKSLQDLSAYEKGKMRPRTLIKSVRNDEDFMLKMQKHYPGMLLHGPVAKAIALGALGSAGMKGGGKLINALIK